MKFPIEEILPKIDAEIRAHSSLIITAPPGAGKSTLVPAHLLRHTLKGDPRQILMFEPRRLSVKTLAAFIAKNLNCRVGDEVGYQIRFENRTSAKTRLKLITEGLFSKLLLSDPYLESISAVIIDEFHERSLNADMALAQIQELQATVRPDLKLVVMSATLDPAPLLKFLPDAVHVHSPGRVFPVDHRYLDRALPPRDEDELLLALKNTVRKIAADHPGDNRDILAFFAGSPEIQRAQETLAPINTELGIRSYPLYGQLKIEEQERAIEPQGHRKIILSTNIAETSITVENLGFVIDTGLVKTARIDFDFGVERLELDRISQYSAEQRAGRAGRLAAGTAYRLWTKNEHQQLKRQSESEIHRVDLSSSLLQIASLGATAESFGWFEKPRAENLKLALDKLIFLGALDSKTQAITDVGRKILEYPYDPRLGKLFTLARDATEKSFVAFVAALLSEGDFFWLERGALAAHHGESDLRRRLEYFATGGNQRIHRKRLDNVGDLFERFGGNRRDLGAWRDRFDEILLLAFPDWLCRMRDNSKADAVMVGGRGVRLFESSEAQGASFFLALDARQLPSSQARVLGVSLAHTVDEKLLFSAGSEFIRKDRKVFLDRDHGKLRALAQRVFIDLPLEEGHPETPSPTELAAHFRDVFSKDFVEALRRDPDTLVLLLRYNLLQTRAPEVLDGHTLEQWQSEVMGLLDIDSDHALGSEAWLRSAMPYKVQQALDREAPLKLEVPTGNRYPIEYREGLPPKLAVRLQEVFGWLASPKLARDRVPVVLELLSPGYKPVQTTEDLENFWNKTYFEVRKELRARYPKHSWPDNPLEAKAVAKGRPRR